MLGKMCGNLVVGFRMIRMKTQIALVRISTPCFGITE